MCDPGGARLYRLFLSQCVNRCKVSSNVLGWWGVREDGEGGGLADDEFDGGGRVVFGGEIGSDLKGDCP